MKEKIKNFIKSNFYNIVVILAILSAFLTVVLKEGWLIILFFLGTIFFLAIVWFFSQDKQIGEFKEIFNKKFPFLGRTIAIVFRILVFLLFLFSIFIVLAGIIDTLKQRRDTLERQQNFEEFCKQDPQCKTKLEFCGQDLQCRARLRLNELKFNFSL